MSDLVHLHDESMLKPKSRNSKYYHVHLNMKIRCAGMYMSTKKPASLMHFRTLALGKAALNLSQWRMEDKPPAEQPPSRAYKGALEQD